VADGVITREAIEAEFPDWEAFQGVDQRWHARLRGADKPVMVHDDDLVGLREEIVRTIGHGNGREHCDLSDRKRHRQPEVIQGQPDGGSGLEGRHVRPALTLRQHNGGGQDEAGRDAADNQNQAEPKRLPRSLKCCLNR
jgi:hypothetical protein